MGRARIKSTPVVIDGIRFQSKAEGRRYAELRLLERSGRVSDLTMQPRYHLRSQNGDKIATYVGDFEYLENGTRVCEDVKGHKTDVYKIKIKWARSDYPGVEFREVAAYG